MDNQAKTDIESKLLIGFALIISFVFVSVGYTCEQVGSHWSIRLILGGGIFVMALVIGLTFLKKLKLAKYILVIIPPFFILGVSLANFYFDVIPSVYAYLIPRFSSVVYLLIPIVFFGEAEKRKMFLTLIIISPSVLFFRFFHTLIGIDVLELPYESQYYDLFFGLFVLFSLASLVTVLLFQKVSYVAERKVAMQNKVLLNDKSVIELNNEKLNSIIQENSDYEAFIEANTDVVFMLDKLGKQLYFNGQMEYLGGYTSEEMIGKSFTKFVPLKEVSKFLGKLKEVFQKKKISPFETFVKHKDGSSIPVEISGRIIRHKNKLVAIGTIRDITERIKKRQIVDFQSNLYTILDITSKNISLNAIFKEVLITLFKIDGLGVEQKGAIFVKNSDGDLELKANVNGEALEKSCALVKPGECLCGRALVTAETNFCNAVGHNHTIKPEGMKEHGHYIVPIRDNHEVLGVICLYVKAGEERKESTVEYLETVANVLFRKITSVEQKDSLYIQNIEINEQHKLLDTVLTELHQSINYTRFLQKSLLPNQSTIDRYMHESSVLFMPRDRVSGDFYFAHAADRYLYFGIGDCTGHGIPGAFLASMSIEAVKTVILSNIGQKPDFLLEGLRNISKSRFNTNLANDRTDSMDMALCLFDKEEGKFYYSGGFISLYLFKKDGELIEVPPTKSPIGEYPIEKQFELNEVIVEKGDTIYMTSDGYFDQFGYDPKLEKKKPKKFMRKRFAEILMKIQDQSCEEQVKTLEKTIVNWRNELEQTDDITVFVAKHA